MEELTQAVAEKVEAICIPTRWFSKAQLAAVTAPTGSHIESVAVPGAFQLTRFIGALGKWTPSMGTTRIVNHDLAIQPNQAPTHPTQVHTQRQSPRELRERAQINLATPA